MSAKFQTSNGIATWCGHEHKFQMYWPELEPRLSGPYGILLRFPTVARFQWNESHKVIALQIAGFGAGWDWLSCQRVPAVQRQGRTR